VLRDQSAVAQRSQKVIDSGNRKLGHVASDALGISGRAMVRALAAGETDATKMADLARKRLRQKKPDVVRALAGRLTDTQRWVLGELLARYDAREAALVRVEAPMRTAIEESPDLFVADAAGLLDTIPGVGEHVAQTMVAEMGGRWSACRVRGTWPVGRGGVQAIMRRRASARQARPRRAAPCSEPRWCRRHGPPPTVGAPLSRRHTIGW
jgi:transposase